MAESAYFPRVANRGADVLESPRHSGVVRLTHWNTAISFFGLLISGVAILLAHPRLYWGETGGVGAPSLVDLPLPFVLVGQSGWGRSLHFLSAWVGVLSGFIYVFWGFLTGHFRKNLLPDRTDLRWRRVTGVVSDHLRLRRFGGSNYNVLQRLTYLAVIFILFPLMIWTGLAMSPAVTSVFPGLVDVLGGQQSARTIHFFAASFVVLFLLVHIAMICRAGFAASVRAMITGHGAKDS